jgi:hypothetical protein
MVICAFAAGRSPGSALARASGPAAWRRRSCRPRHAPPAPARRRRRPPRPSPCRGESRASCVAPTGSRNNDGRRLTTVRHRAAATPDRGCNNRGRARRCLGNAGAPSRRLWSSRRPRPRAASGAPRSAARRQRRRRPRSPAASRERRRAAPRCVRGPGNRRSSDLRCQFRRDRSCAGSCTTRSQARASSATTCPMSRR